MKFQPNNVISYSAAALVLAMTFSNQTIAGDAGHLKENTRVDVDGTLAVAIRENLESGESKLDFFLERGVDAVPIQLLFAGGPPKELRAGIGIRVRGLVRNGRIQVDAAQSATSDGSATQQEGTLADPAFTLDEPTVAVIMVNPSDMSHTSTAIANMADYYFGDTHSMKDMYKEISFGQLVMNEDADADGSPDVFGPVTLNVTAAELCDAPFNHTSAAEQLVPGFNAGLYDHRIYAIPKDLPCGWTGYAYVSCGSSCRAFNRWSFDVNTTSHEFGHNRGLSHAGVGTNVYADYSSFMGYSISNRVRGLDGAHHWLMGWYDAIDDFAAQTVTSSGAFTISSIGDDPALTTAPTLLRIQVPNGAPYFLSTRQAVGYDSDLVTLNPESLDGISVHRMSDTSYQNSDRVAQLAVGETFTDAENNLTITQLSGKNTDGTVAVDIVLDQVVACNVAQPGLSVSPSSARVAAGGSQGFAVNVSNNDSSGCDSVPFAVSNGLGFQDIVNLAPGSNGSTSFALTGGTADGDTTSASVLVTAPDHPSASRIVTLTVDAAGPEAPTNLSGSYRKKGKNHKVTLQWDASVSPDTAAYEVFREGTSLGTTAQTSFVETLAGAPSSPIAYSVIPSDDLGNVGTSASTTVDPGSDGDGDGGGGGGKCHPKRGC